MIVSRQVLVDALARVCGVGTSDLFSKSRVREIVEARRAIAVTLREHNTSFQEIAHLLMRKNHTTAFSAYYRAMRELDNDEHFRSLVHACRKVASSIRSDAMRSCGDSVGCGVQNQWLPIVSTTASADKNNISVPHVYRVSNESAGHDSGADRRAVGRKGPHNNYELGGTVAPSDGGNSGCGRNHAVGDAHVNRTRTPSSAGGDGPSQVVQGKPGHFTIPDYLCGDRRTTTVTSGPW